MRGRYDGCRVAATMKALAAQPLSEPPASAAALREDVVGRLDRAIAELWAQAREGKFWRHVTAYGCDPELYLVTMLQIFHYTRHNSIHQAVAALRVAPEQSHLLRYAYTHAREELGHERMIVHDLQSLGLLADGESIPPPLPATDALINYLYGVALRDGALPRLGYSYWAESAYAYFGPLLLKVRESLSLTDNHMTFFVAHSAIDERHSAQVRRALCDALSTREDADAVVRVAVTTLWLTIQILDQALDAWTRTRGVV
jgi:hypothetical protein